MDPRHYLITKSNAEDKRGKHDTAKRGDFRRIPNTEFPSTD
jgi:hypothetical protein